MAAIAADSRRANGRTSLHSRKLASRSGAAASSSTYRAAGQLIAAAADSIREIRSILAAVGVPTNAIYVASLSSNSICASQHQAQLFEVGRGRGTLRPMAEGSWPIHSSPVTSKIGRTGISAAPLNAILRRWSTIPLILFSRAAKRHPMRRVVQLCLSVTGRVKVRPVLMLVMTPAKSAM